MSIKNILQQSLEIIKTELLKSKKLSTKQLNKFKSIYGLSDIDGEIYVNPFNIILTSSSDYENIKYVIQEEDKVVILEIAEYGLSLYIIRKFNNLMLDEALD